jgi:ketosteroid isomerase-like protein
MHRYGLGRFRARGALTACATSAALGVFAACAMPRHAVAAEASSNAAGAPATKTDSEPATAANTSDAAAKAALAVVEGFERALADGDRNAALEALAPDLVVFESGHVERSREEYAASHLDADIAFLKTAKTRLLSRSAGIVGESAVVLSETQIHSEREDKATTRASLETLLLRRTAHGWRITHIHWSSRVL